ncbi:seryl-tRNA synthetase [Oceanicola sp. 22II-s10i]|uniref:tryptophan-rich sensory protein n=1 Tax=Oceanicola sp. 22II-s10i TaxID=1317116 RepID=UPI000B6AA57B|nr:tryptophan-rich sensory protein [Oceanicola sp. 22II-s10i]OWU82974.1 seryl-tRNA synthetase [Oceanicola sp. 22II-s10i]
MTRMKAILALTAALAFAISPVVTPGFAGFSPDQFPVPQVDPPIQPPGWAFSIWGLIYAWLIASTGYGLLRRAEDPAWDAHRWPLIISLTLGAAWVPLATVSPLWATVLIWLMLIPALAALLRAPRSDTLLLATPLGLYAGWLTAATCVATAILATGYGATPVIPIHAALVLLALAIGLTTLRLRPASHGYAAALIWALAGIAASNLTPTVWLILIPAAAGILLVLATTFLRRPA